MNKIFAIGLKDLRLIFQDRAALLLMLLAPYLITLGLGFVSGAFEDDAGNSGISDIPVMIINQDTGTLGEQLVILFESDDLADLIEVVPAADVTAGKALVDADELAALVIIPAEFSAMMIPDQSTGDRVIGEQLEIYRSPGRPISASVIQTIVGEFMRQVDAGSILVTVTIDQLVEQGDFDIDMLASLVGLSVPEAIDQFDSDGEIDPELFSGLADSDQEASGNLITIDVNSGAVNGEEDDEFNILAVLAPGMALFFLMYTVTLGGRSILQERTAGTLARMQTTATSGAQILGGKVLGIFLTGAAQVGILVIGSSLMYGIQWGDWLGVIALILSAALAATGWGLFVAGAAQTQEQVAGIGTALMLMFGAISGTFTQIDNQYINWIGAITPNQWALQGFTKLGLGQSFADILPNIGALWLLAAVLFVISTILFRRKLS
ncbi:MAG: ABC transporter permease [Anaerolineae bacterium]